MNIAFYEMPQWQEDYISKKLSAHKLFFFPESFSETNLPSPQTDVLCVFAGCPTGSSVMQSVTNLKLVVTRSTGYDHIDTLAAKSRGVVVCNVPTYGANTVAEFTFGLILALSRKIYPAIRRVREQHLFNSEGLQGFDLAGKTIGVIGTGHIGAHVIAMAHGFNMKIVAYDPKPNAELSASYDVEYLELEKLLETSDVITIHVPYLPVTHHLLNKDNMQKIKKGAVLINTARGGLIDTEALITSLQTGRLSGAALDVLEEEGLVQEEMHILEHGHPNQEQLRVVLEDHLLMGMDNVLITPHTAFQTREAIYRILDTTVENILLFADGKPQNIVN